VKTNRRNSYTPRIMANQVSLNLRWFTFASNTQLQIGFSLYQG
jgi:hypothetical protein